MTNHTYCIATIGRPPRDIRFVARCACGWQSEPMPRAGMAHAAHDAHAETTP